MKVRSLGVKGRLINIDIHITFIISPLLNMNLNFAGPQTEVTNCAMSHSVMFRCCVMLEKDDTATHDW